MCMQYKGLRIPAVISLVPSNLKSSLPLISTLARQLQEEFGDLNFGPGLVTDDISNNNQFSPGAKRL